MYAFYQMLLGTGTSSERLPDCWMLMMMMILMINSVEGVYILNIGDVMMGDLQTGSSNSHMCNHIACTIIHHFPYNYCEKKKMMMMPWHWLGQLNLGQCVIMVKTISFSKFAEHVCQFVLLIDLGNDLGSLTQVS